MTRPYTVLAFDFGLKRIGIACGDTVTRQAAPRRAVTMRGGVPRERVAAGDANTFESEVEGEDGLRARHAPQRERTCRLSGAREAAPAGVPKKLRV